MPQLVCPWNVSFAKELTEPEYAAHAGLDLRDARALAREFLTTSQREFSARCKGSAMKRAMRPWCPATSVFRFARRLPNRAEHCQWKRLARSIIAATADRI